MFFFWRPSQDRLRREISEVLGGCGVHVETLWSSISGPAMHFFDDACTIKFMLEFWLNLGAGWESQE